MGIIGIYMIAYDMIANDTHICIAYFVKSIGPRTDPRGAPNNKQTKDDTESLVVTFWLRSVK